MNHVQIYSNEHRQRLRLRSVLLTFLLCLLVAVTTAQVPTVPFSGPLIITKGGIYTGNYRSLDSAVPCVTVATSEPVTLTNCVLAGAGDLIKTSGFVNVTITYCRGYGLPPSRDNTPRGRFLNAYNARRLVVEHNYLEQTSGMLVDRWSGNDIPSQQALLIRYNQGLNCDKRYRNGGYGDHRAFLMLNTVRQVPNVDISWNEFINKPNESLVEDNINFYNSSGTKASPISCHDNFVWGAYPYPATASYFSGSGITVDGSRTDGGTAETTSAYINCSNNQVVGTCNAAMNIAIGHDVAFTNNRMVASGQLANGTKLYTTWAACCIFNGSSLPSSVFYNNSIRDNIIGFVRWGSFFPYLNRHDQDVSSGNNKMPLAGNEHLPNPITYASEEKEYDAWRVKLRAAGIRVGAATPGAALPVQLTCFVGQIARKQVLISWQTATERNSSYFEVQQAGPDGVFTPTTTVAAAGASQAPRAYEVALPLPVPAQDSFWRLKMVDLDQSTTYSQVVAITAQPQAQPVQQQLLTMLGQQVWSRPWQERADLTGLHPGLYVLVTVYTDGTRLSEKTMIP